VLGQLLAAVVMLLGFGIITIPTGIITVETMQQVRRGGRSCLSCGASAHHNKALHCDQCGAILPPAAS
jgi:voltage-gated potassium channel